MSLAAPLLETRLSGLAPHRQGKVRDIFDLGDSLLMVATDRISAFDYVLGSGIPDKGKVLTQLSAFWFEKTAKWHSFLCVFKPVVSSTVIFALNDIFAGRIHPADVEHIDTNTVAHDSIGYILRESHQCAL